MFERPRDLAENLIWSAAVISIRTGKRLLREIEYHQTRKKAAREWCKPKSVYATGMTKPPQKRHP